jgi:hypothetical protein
MLCSPEGRKRGASHASRSRPSPDREAPGAKLRPIPCRLRPRSHRGCAVLTFAPRAPQWGPRCRIEAMSEATIAKADVLELLNGLPDDIEIEDLIHRLYLREKLAAAEVDIAAGRTVTMAEARAEAASWRS